MKFEDLKENSILWPNSIYTRENQIGWFPLRILKINYVPKKIIHYQLLNYLKLKETVEYASGLFDPTTCSGYSFLIGCPKYFIISEKEYKLRCIQ